MIWTDDFKKKKLEWALELGFFSTFVIFVSHGPTLGHVSDHVGMCHVERSWKADTFRHTIFENRTKIEGVMALTIQIFQITQCIIQCWNK